MYGEVAERLKAQHWKCCDVKAFVGSNPILSSIIAGVIILRLFVLHGELMLVKKVQALLRKISLRYYKREAKIASRLVDFKTFS